MPRMNLNTVEREAFESPPVFNSVQRKQYFDFPAELRRLAGELRAPILSEYDFSDGKLQDTVGIKPPKLAGQRDTFLGVAKRTELQGRNGLRFKRATNLRGQMVHNLAAKV
jgi:hypothetical protein